MYENFTHGGVGHIYCTLNEKQMRDYILQYNNFGLLYEGLYDIG